MDALENRGEPKKEPLSETSSVSLEQQLKLIKAILDSHPEPTIVVDKDLKVVYYNEAHEGENSSIPRIGSVMYRDYASHHTIDMYKETVAAIETGKEKRFSELTYNGGKKILCIRIQPYEYGAIITCRNITKEKEKEKEVAHARSLECIADFASLIAHDLNNCFTAMVGLKSLMSVELDNIERGTGNIADSVRNIREYVSEYNLSSKRVSGLISKLFSFSKGAKPNLEDISFSDAASGIEEIVRGNKSRIQYKLPEKLYRFDADRVQINQVISNLVINAVQAAPDGGPIIIGAENIANGESYVADFLLGKKEIHKLPNLSDRKYIKIFVQDFGVGISKENMAKLFTPGFTTKENGHGIGLMGSYLVVISHNGYMTVESSQENGKSGTIFSIYLPAKEE